MKVWNNSSTESRKCIVCGRMAGDSKAFTQNGMEFLIPACGEHKKQVDVDTIASGFLTFIKKAINN